MEVAFLVYMTRKGLLHVAHTCESTVPVFKASSPYWSYTALVSAVDMRAQHVSTQLVSLSASQARAMSNHLCHTLAEHLVGLAHLVEEQQHVRVVGALVRVALQRQRAEGLRSQPHTKRPHTKVPKHSNEGQGQETLVVVVVVRVVVCFVVVVLRDTREAQLVCWW